ncbi:hypothetical protein CCACVL1_29892, partial [Corchorus capsularis]
IELDPGSLGQTVEPSGRSGFNNYG